MSSPSKPGAIVQGVDAEALEGDPPLRRALAIQLRVIGALLMREIITRYGRDNLGFLWVFIEPMIFTLGIVALWSAMGLGHHSLPIVAFAITGYSSILLWRNMPSRCVMAIPPNMGLLYHRNVRVLDLFVARILLEMGGATMSFTVLASLFTAMGWMNGPEDLGKVLFGWLLLAWYGTSLALVLGALSAYSDLVERLWFPIAYLLFPLSGAAFMVDWLPPKFQEILYWLPMVHGVELVRDGYFGQVVKTHYDVPFMAGVCLVTTLVGLALVRGAGRRVELQ
jgi:ABC-type polysaccharide/polyol phosphate export permease